MSLVLENTYYIYTTNMPGYFDGIEYMLRKHVFGPPRMPKNQFLTQNWHT